MSAVLRAKKGRKWLYDLGKVCFAVPGGDAPLVALAAQYEDFYSWWRRGDNPPCVMIELIVHWRSHTKVTRHTNCVDKRTVVRTEEDWQAIVTCLTELLDTSFPANSKKNDSYEFKAVYKEITQLHLNKDAGDMQIVGFASRIVSGCVKSGGPTECPPGEYHEHMFRWSRKICKIIKKHFPGG
jgi:hypothetical protein